MQRLGKAAAILAIVAQPLLMARPALAVNPIVVPFVYTGAEQSWTVPAGVTSIHVDLVGGKGGNGSSGAIGGFGAVAGGVLDVTGVPTLYIEVGGNGGNGIAPGPGVASPWGSSGFNGGGRGGASLFGSGGGGGGMSDIRTTARPSTAGVLIVAGGGGGGGAGSNGGAGGAAGQSGGASTSGGGGGGGASAPQLVGGAAGGSVVAGLGGTPGDGIGYSGGGGANYCSSAALCDIENGAAGGGGGAGRFGGGGGGGGSTSGGGGGGGLTYAGDTNAGLTTSADTIGIPSITITYDLGPGPTPTAPPDHGTVDATVTMAQSVVCLELSTSSVDFGTRRFGDVGAAATPGVTVTNCGGIGEDVLAHGTDATGTGPTTWTLDDTGTCDGGTLPSDHYALALERQDTNAQVRLSTVNKALETLGGGAAIDHLARIDTPCPGGSGAGVVMSMQITFVATESAP
jgi:hypothetical protein